MTPTSHYLQCQGRELHLTAWGDPQAEVVGPGTAWPAPGATWTTSPPTWPSAGG
jgi:hypothetical protein